MTRAEWDKMEKTPGKRFRCRSGTMRGERVGTAMSYFKYTVRLRLKETDNLSAHGADEQFACEQVDEA